MSALLMNVGQLIDELQKFKPSEEVVMLNWDGFPASELNPTLHLGKVFLSYEPPPMPPPVSQQPKLGKRK